MSIIVLSLALALASDAFADEYTPLGALAVEDGRVHLVAGNAQMSAGECISIGPAIHSSKWQRRDNPESPWIDIPGTEVEEHVCSYSPTEPGEYRLVGEFIVDGEKGKYASANILIVSQEREVTSRPAEGPETTADEEDKGETAVEVISWGFLKSRATH